MTQCQASVSEKFRSSEMSDRQIPTLDPKMSKKRRSADISLFRGSMSSYKIENNTYQRYTHKNGRFMTFFNILTLKNLQFLAADGTLNSKRCRICRMSQNCQNYHQMANLGRDSGMARIHENGSFIKFGRELPHNFYNLWPI